MRQRLILATVLIVALLGDRGGSAEPTGADTLVVRDVAVFLQLRNEARLSDEPYFAASLPPGGRSRRKLATGDAAKSPQPLGLITFEGTPARDVELSLQLITARKLAEWPEGQSRSTRLIWTGMELSRDQKGTNGAKPTEFPDVHWLTPVARGSDRLGIAVGRRFEQMLLYDLSLKRPLQLTVRGVEGGYFLEVSGEGPIHDVTVLRPAGDGKWIRAEGGSLGAALKDKKDTAKPAPEAAVFDDATNAKAAPAKKKAAAKEEASATEKPKEAASGMPTSVEGARSAEAGEKPEKPEPPPAPNVLVGSNGPQSAEDVFEPLSRRLVELGLGTVEVDHVLRILKQSALREDQATVIYRLDPAVLDGLLPLDVAPPPQKVIRVGLVVVQGLDPAVEEKVAGLIEQLADRSWKVREEAQGAIQEIGPAAVPKLKEALKSKDPEVVFRAEQLLEVLDQSGPGGR